MKALFPFLSEVTEFFLQNRVKILVVLAGSFVMGYAKKVLVLSIYKKVEKSAV